MTAAQTAPRLPDRYTVTENRDGLGFSNGISQSDDGEYVSIRDYAALTADRDALRDVLESKRAYHVGFVSGEAKNARAVIALREENGVLRTEKHADAEAIADLTADSGGVAFPRFVPDGHYNGSVDCEGMFLRDWFAGQALAGMTVSHEPSTRDVMDASDAAYAYADAMIAARSTPSHSPEVIRLVLAAREAWENEGNCTASQIMALDRALEVFSASVPYANAPATA